MANFIDLTLECNGRTMTFGKSETGVKREFGITKIEGGWINSGWEADKKAPHPHRGNSPG